ncbi:MAG: YraN family protein [Bacteroidales bacterium]|nr:YraN family protein [Bacteroidales bacterium]
MAAHNDLGKLGEDLAIQYLTDKGYEILERNWHNIHKEVDIIAKDGQYLVIVEVKTRQNDEYGEPDLAVTKRKQRMLIAAANAYISRKELDMETRFDIISIVVKDSDPVIEHIEDAFLP